MVRWTPCVFWHDDLSHYTCAHTFHRERQTSGEVLCSGFTFRVAVDLLSWPFHPFRFVSSAPWSTSSPPWWSSTTVRVLICHPHKVSADWSSQVFQCFKVRAFRLVDTMPSPPSARSEADSNDTSRAIVPSVEPGKHNAAGATDMMSSCQTTTDALAKMLQWWIARLSAHRYLEACTKTLKTSWSASQCSAPRSPFHTCRCWHWPSTRSSARGCAHPLFQSTLRLGFWTFFLFMILLRFILFCSSCASMLLNRLRILVLLVSSK